MAPVSCIRHFPVTQQFRVDPGNLDRLPRWVAQVDTYLSAPNTQNQLCARTEHTPNKGAKNASVVGDDFDLTKCDHLIDWAKCGSNHHDPLIKRLGLHDRRIHNCTNGTTASKEIRSCRMDNLRSRWRRVFMFRSTTRAHVTRLSSRNNNCALLRLRRVFA